VKKPWGCPDGCRATNRRRSFDPRSRGRAGTPSRATAPASRAEAELGLRRGQYNVVPARNHGRRPWRCRSSSTGGGGRQRSGRAGSPSRFGARVAAGARIGGREGRNPRYRRKRGDMERRPTATKIRGRRPATAVLGLGPPDSRVEASPLALIPLGRRIGSWRNRRGLQRFSFERFSYANPWRCSSQVGGVRPSVDHGRQAGFHYGFIYIG
jgi:hypothetical protein